ncbi:alpha/beta hydrolase [uncultured Cohaesibacter sp.]|uniref:alpha/beta fold hydrolase n=1 Tax=uncultured Cohaesibacter sp. TaxID=1002546 RepID=UPI00292E5698|nr:alpha/beta hydrolase [uncultured Cohaesibacter sp.]
MSVFRSEESAAKISQFVEMRYEQSGLARRVVKTSFGPTHLLEAGRETAPVVILLHGSSSNGMAWLGDIALLSAQFRVIVPDMPGEPGLSVDRRLSFARGEPQDWLAEVMATCEVHRAALVGNSLGGWLALHFAARNSERVSALALIAPSGLCPPRAGFLFKAMFWMLFGAFGIDRINKLVFGDVAIPKDVTLFSHLVARGFKPMMEALPLLGDEDLEQIKKLPTLYIAGLHDALLNSELSAKRLEGQAVIDVRPDQGHVIMDAGRQVEEFLLGALIK